MRVVGPHFPEGTETRQSKDKHIKKAKARVQRAARTWVCPSCPVHVGTGDHVGMGSGSGAYAAGGPGILHAPVCEPRDEYHLSSSASVY